MEIEWKRLGQLSALLGETTRQIQRAVDEGLAPRPEKHGKYDAWAIARGMVQYYRDRSTRVSAARIVDAARRAKAQADLAEMEAAEKRGSLISKSEAERMISELAVQTRQKIAEADYIPKESRQRLSKELERMKIT